MKIKGKCVNGDIKQLTKKKRKKWTRRDEIEEVKGNLIIIHD